MLVLSRRRDEGVTIGPDIRVMVLGVKGDAAADQGEGQDPERMGKLQAREKGRHQ